MTKTIDEHLQEVQQKRGRITELKHSILGGEKNLKGLESSYKEAVINDSKNIDELYHEIESLQAKLKADKHKFTTLKNVTEDHLRESAFNVLLTFPNVKPTFRNEVQEVYKAIKLEQERHEKSMQALREKGEEINKRYENESYRYWDLIEQNGIVGKVKNEYGVSSPEINTRLQATEEKARAEFRLIPNQLYNEIEGAAEGRNSPFKMKL